MSVFSLRMVGALFGVAGMTAGVSVGIAVVRAHADPADPAVPAAAGADSSIVERFEYPNADAIKVADPRVVLLHGDGHIVYDATCTFPPTGTGQIKVRPQAGATPICFTVTGGTGWLGMRIEGVYEIDGRKATTATGQTATATVQPQNEAEQNVALRTTTITPIGVEGNNTVPTVLLDLTVTAS